MSKKLLFVVALLLALITACKSKTTKVVNGDTLKRTSNTNDTITSNNKQDSISEEIEADCYTNFFNASEPVDTNNITVINEEGKQIQLRAFIKENLEKEYLNIALKNVDHDTIPELWIRNFTMGAHCCDEIYVFLKQPSGKYKQTAKMSAGNVCISDTVFTFSFDEPLGYFMSCFACGFEDSAKGFVMMREVNFKFTKGKFQLIHYTAKEETQLFKNLQILKDEGVRAMEEGMDNGVRKEFAMNFCVYYYNHGKDLASTKKLFDTYYTFKDATKVWKEFITHLKDFKEYNGI